MVESTYNSLSTIRSVLFSYTCQCQLSCQIFLVCIGLNKALSDLDLRPPMASPAARPGMIRPEATLQAQEPGGESNASDESTSKPLRDTFEFTRGRAPRRNLAWKTGKLFRKKSVIDKSQIGELPEITRCLSVR
jgi:hypothetical protein